MDTARISDRSHSHIHKLTQAKLHNNGDSKDRRVSHIHKLSFITMETARTDESHSHIHKLSFITMDTARKDGSD